MVATQGMGNCHYRSLIILLLQAPLASDSVDGEGKRGVVWSGVTKARISSGKVGDGARVGTAMMTGHSKHSGIWNVPCMATEEHTSNRVELGVGTLCLSLANRMDPHWVDC